MLPQILCWTNSYALIPAPQGWPGKLYSERYVYLSHYVWWKKTGELVGPGEMIIFKDKNPANCAFKNLQKMTRAENMARSKKYRIRYVYWFCDHCKGLKTIPSHDYRGRVKSGRKYFFCSRSCAATFHLSGKKKKQVMSNKTDPFKTVIAGRSIDIDPWNSVRRKKTAKSL